MHNAALMSRVTYEIQCGCIPGKLESIYMSRIDVNKEPIIRRMREYDKVLDHVSSGFAKSHWMWTL